MRRVLRERIVILRGRRCKLLLPFEYSRTCGGGFGFRNVAALLQRDGKAGVCEGVLRGQHGQGQRDCHSGLELLCVSQGANQAVMGLDMSGIGGDCRAEGPRCGCGVSGGEQVEAVLRKLVAARQVGFRRRGHIFIVTSATRPSR